MVAAIMPVTTTGEGEEQVQTGPKAKVGGYVVYPMASPANAYTLATIKSEVS